ncbi:MAG: MBL fold metallo-hydrolase, partial [Chromatocurvus sp.]
AMKNTHPGLTFVSSGQSDLRALLASARTPSHYSASILPRKSPMTPYIMRLPDWLAKACIVALWSIPTLAQDYADVEIETRQIRDGVYVLFGEGGNIGLATGPEATFLVDDDYAPLAPRVRAAIAAVTARPVDFLVNTHWHGDHAGGNEAFAEAGALVIAHDNVRARMATKQEIAAFNRSVPPSPPAALPVVTFSESTTFHMNGDTVSAVHAPHAHTDGDAIVHWEKANIIHMGDTFFNGTYPFIDLSSGGNVRGMIAAAETALAIANAETVVIPGHGPLAAREDLRAYHEMLVTISDRVREGIERGKSLAEIQALRPTADHDGRLDGSFISGDRFTEFVYQSLAP